MTYISLGIVSGLGDLRFSTLSIQIVELPGKKKHLVYSGFFEIYIFLLPRTKVLLNVLVFPLFPCLDVILLAILCGTFATA